MIKLEDFFQEWQKEISISKGGYYSFNAESCPQPPNLLETGNLIAKKTFHQYHPSFRVDHVELFGKKEILKHFGLLILSSLFHGKSSPIYVKLTNKLSEINTLVIEPPDYLRSGKTSGYHTKPYSFNYWPAEVVKHPWFGQSIISPNDYPSISLTNEGDVFLTEDDFLRRDILRGFGTDAGKILFSELLLNISRDENSQDEFHLEVEGGFRGVAPQSCELSIWLPGSFNWWGSIASALE